MKNLLKKLHKMSNQPDYAEGSKSTSSRGRKSAHKSSPRSQLNPEHKPLSGLSNWLNSVGNRQSPSPPSPSNLSREERLEPSDLVDSLDDSDASRQDSEFSYSKDPEMEEEYQIKLALELSAREDPEAVQIEAVKKISLGSCAPENTLAEVVAYRYWNYNALGYDDKITDGFYDLYGTLTESIPERMPSLIDLQGAPILDSVSWEAVLVNRASDATLLRLEQKALEMAEKSRSGSLLVIDHVLVQNLAILVADFMGGAVRDPDKMAREWRDLRHKLKATTGSMVLPLGSFKVGLARHRALLFKVLADSLGIPCQLAKGKQYTGSEEAAMNIIKINDGREYIVDLMADPGTLIPSDAAGSHIECDGSFRQKSLLSRDVDSSHVASVSSGGVGSPEEHSDFRTRDKGSGSRGCTALGSESDDKVGSPLCTSSTVPIKVDEKSNTSSDNFKCLFREKKALLHEHSGRHAPPFMHARSPSWTEGVSSPDVHRMKMKNVSEYMIDAAKENPQLAERLHNVLRESGVIAPPNLFTEIYPDPSKAESDFQAEAKHEIKQRIGTHIDHDSPPKFLPPLPPNKADSKLSTQRNQQEHLENVEGLRFDCLPELRKGRDEAVLSHFESTQTQCKGNVPVATAAAAASAALVVASSMVAAAAQANPNIELPVEVTASATAAFVRKQYDQGLRTRGDADGSNIEPQNSGDGKHDAIATNSEGERIFDRSTGNDGTKSDVMLEDVADCEIPWEDIALGERIGLGSYGEVYRGEWHGTEVAVKRFLNQDISGESLQEFRSEVRIMKKARHPNVVLFMGAVTRPPNLSIITEFLPRGSLYRLLHRPNNQLDERRRLRMALDAARGMNYLHNCYPVIVHRDLKSPNLLVDKNWVVKVCDFGLSRMKHSTFLSSRSTAGTAEWMAPEVLRNEPANEKCDVYSFGVILWELCTMQQPWMGMNPMQVVGAVGFQHRRLDIPDSLDPAIADIIRMCWQTDPKMRPTFAEIMAALKPLQKPIASSRVPRPLPVVVATTRDAGFQGQ